MLSTWIQNYVKIPDCKIIDLYVVMERNFAIYRQSFAHFIVVDFKIFV